MNERKFDTIPDHPTVDNMADVFDEKLSAETEEREGLRYAEEFKFTDIDIPTIADLRVQIEELPFIMSDDYDHLPKEDVLTWIRERKYENLPQHNGLRDIAHQLNDAHDASRYED